MVEREELLAVLGFAVGEALVEAVFRECSVLEAALGEDRHFHSRDGFDAAGDDLAFEFVEAGDVVFCDVDEGDGFGYGDDVGPGEGAEALEAVVVRGGVGAGVGAAEAARVGKGVFDFADAPAFLVEHLVVDDAVDGELGVFLDGVVFEVFVAAVAVDEVAPAGVAVTDAAAEGEGHGGGFDVERLVVFGDADGFGGVEGGGVGFDGLEEEFEV